MNILGMTIVLNIAGNNYDNFNPSYLLLIYSTMLNPGIPQLYATGNNLMKNL